MVGRLLLIPAGCVIAFLGLYQAANMIAVRDIAAPGSLFALVSPAQAANVSALLSLRVRLTSEQRYLATVALAEVERSPNPQSIAQMSERIAILPHTPDDQALRARLALLRGNHQAAFVYALDARQMNIVDSEIARIAKTGDVAGAIALQHQVIVTLEGHRTDREALADAYWRLGVLENLAAQHPRGLDHLQLAAQAFERNVGLTPLSGRALLSAGYAELFTGDWEKSTLHFRAAVAADPASASGYVGLARVALTRNKRAEALEELQKAERIAPLQPDVQRIAHLLMP